MSLRSPFNGVLLNFDLNIGNYDSQGILAAEIYTPDAKNVETFIFVAQLVNTTFTNIIIGNPVNVSRINGKICLDIFSGIGTKVNLETQNVKTTIKFYSSCARSMFLNKAFEIKSLLTNG